MRTKLFSLALLLVAQLANASTLVIGGGGGIVGTGGGSGQGSVATDSIWNAKGDLAAASAGDTGVILARGTDGQILSTDSAETMGLKWITPGAGTGNAIIASGISQFPTGGDTSAQLLDVISDEVGTGALVFANSPTLVAPSLGAAVASSIDGHAFPAGTDNVVTTDAVQTLTGKTILASDNVVIADTVESLDNALGAIACLGMFCQIAGTSVHGDNIQLSAQAVGSLMYYSNATAWVPLPIGTAGKVLAVNAGATAPEWVNVPGVTEVNNLESASVGILVNEIPVGTGTNSITYTAMPTTGTNGCAGSTNALQFNTTTHAFGCNLSVGGGGSGHLIEDDVNGALPTESTLRFTGNGIVCSDSSPKTVCDVAAGGDAVTSGDITQFAAITSANLDLEVTDDTGTGALVFANAPTLIAPVLGTIASGVGTALTAITATNLTGQVPVANGGTGAATLTTGGFVFATGTSPFTASARPTNGQIPIGDASGVPSLAQIQPTANETEVTNGDGTITIGIPTNPSLAGTVTASTAFTVTGGCSTTNSVTCQGSNAGGGFITLPEDTDLGASTWTLDVAAVNLTGNFSISPAVDGTLSGATLLTDATTTPAKLTAAAKTRICEHTYTNPASATNDAVEKCYIPDAATITRMYCYTSTGTYTVNLYERAEATPGTGTTEMVTTDLVCDTDGQVTTTFTDAALAANSLLTLNLQTATLTGTLGIVVEYTVN